jgi:hypothetical protein
VLRYSRPEVGKSILQGSYAPEKLLEIWNFEVPGKTGGIVAHNP